MKKLMSAFVSVAVFVFLFLASARVEGQQLYPSESVRGQMYCSGESWNIKRVWMVNPKTKRLELKTIYETTRLNSWIPTIVTGLGFQVMSDTCPTISIIDINTANPKGWMTGKTSFWITTTRTGDKFFVEATFMESARNPDPQDPQRGRLMFMGNWEITRGTGIYGNVKGNGTWEGTCSYEGPSFGPVSSFTFLAEDVAKVIFRCTLYKGPMTNIRNSIRPINTHIIPPLPEEVEEEEEDIPPDEGDGDE